MRPLRGLVTATLFAGVVAAWVMTGDREQAVRLQRMVSQPGAELAPATDIAQTFAPLSETDVAQLDKMRAAAAQQMRRHVGSPPAGDAEDTRRVEELLASVDPATLDQQTLAGIGIVLGESLRAEYPLDWVRVHDRFGQTFALKSPEQACLLFPLAWLPKRVEAGVPLEVARLVSRMHEVIAPCGGA
jgi:hypothetical protein